MRAIKSMNIAKRALISNSTHRIHQQTPYIFATRHLDIKVVSAQENAQNKHSVEAKRPISPHFNIYKWPFAGLASGTQRVTGFALVLGILRICDIDIFVLSILIILYRLDNCRIIIIARITSHCITNIY